jgi:hypothetical protein
MNWKGFGRKRLLPDLRYSPEICLEGLKKMSVRITMLWAEI